MRFHIAIHTPGDAVLTEKQLDQLADVRLAIRNLLIERCARYASVDFEITTDQDHILYKRKNEAKHDNL